MNTCPECGGLYATDAVCSCVGRPNPPTNASESTEPKVQVTNDDSRIDATAKAAAKQFCTFTAQEKGTEEYLAEIIQNVINETRRWLIVGWTMDNVKKTNLETQAGSLPKYRMFCNDPKWQPLWNEEDMRNYAAQCVASAVEAARAEWEDGHTSELVMLKIWRKDLIIASETIRKAEGLSNQYPSPFEGAWWHASEKIRLELQSELITRRKEHEAIVGSLQAELSRAREELAAKQKLFKVDH